MGDEEEEITWLKEEESSEEEMAARCCPSPRLGKRQAGVKFLSILQVPSCLPSMPHAAQERLGMPSPWILSCSAYALRNTMYYLGRRHSPRPNAMPAMPCYMSSRQWVVV